MRFQLLFDEKKRERKREENFFHGKSRENENVQMNDDSIHFSSTEKKTNFLIISSLH